MMYIHGNNETDKTINVSKIANTSTLDDNSTAAGCNSRLMIIHILGSCLKLSNKHQTRSTQPCIPSGSLNRVPASAKVTAGMSPLPGGR